MVETTDHVSVSDNLSFSENSESNQTVAPIGATQADDPEMLEGESGLDSSHVIEDSVYPVAEIRVAKNQYSLFQIKKMVEDRKQMILAPDFQRKEVWNKRQQCELVESILMGIPLPVIYLFETRHGELQVVDGRQRISSIIAFMNDEVKLSDLKILKEFNGKLFSKLTPLMQGRFEDFQLLCYIIQPPTPERVKYDLFDRVNRGGTKLNSQEMRNALYQGNATRLLKKVAESNEFKIATGNGVSSNRMRDQYAVLRILGFFLLFTGSLGNDEDGREIKYKSDIDDFLSKVMIRINHASKEELDKWESDLTTAFAEIYKVLGEDAFRFDPKSHMRRPVNMPLMEVLTYLFMKDWKRFSPHNLREVINQEKQRMDNSGIFKSVVDSSRSVCRRFVEMDNFRAFLNKTSRHYD